HGLMRLWRRRSGTGRLRGVRDARGLPFIFRALAERDLVARLRAGGHDGGTRFDGQKENRLIVVDGIHPLRAELAVALRAVRPEIEFQKQGDVDLRFQNFTLHGNLHAGYAEVGLDSFSVWSFSLIGRGPRAFRSKGRLAASRVRCFTAPRPHSADECVSRSGRRWTERSRELRVPPVRRLCSGTRGHSKTRR